MPEIEIDSRLEEGDDVVLIRWTGYDYEVLASWQEEN